MRFNWIIIHLIQVKIELLLMSRIIEGQANSDIMEGACSLSSS